MKMIVLIRKEKEIKMAWERKQKLFVLFNTLAWCLIGALRWFVIGDKLIDND